MNYRSATIAASVLPVTIALVGTGFAKAAEPKPPAVEEPAEVIILPVLRVTGDLLEDFGFRVSPVIDNYRGRFLPVYTPVVDLVLPNTAASKAGVRPGDRIITADGQPTGDVMSRSLSVWVSIQKKKWNEQAATKGSISWELEVEHVWTRKRRTVLLQLPTPAPHWGVTAWSAPEDRVPVEVPEAGPLAARAGEILNNGIWMVLRETYLKGFRLPTDAAHPMFLCYQWTLWDDNGGHRMLVSRQRGRTDIILEAIARANNTPGGAKGRSPDETLAAAITTLATSAKAYLTSPSGELIAALDLAPPKTIPLPDAQAGFRAEMEFWLTKVGQTSPLWPLGVLEPDPARRK